MRNAWSSERRVDVPGAPRGGGGGWLFAFEPRPLAPPQLAVDMAEAPWLVRVPVAVAHLLLRVEYAMSPGGHLRAWLVLNLRLLLVGLILVLGVSPVLFWVLELGTAFSDAATAFFKSIFEMLLYVVGIFGVLALLAALNWIYRNGR